MLKLEEELLGLLNVASSIVGSIVEEFTEEVSSPLDTMFDLVGEVSQGAHRDGFFRRILRISIALSFVRDNHL